MENRKGIHPNNIWNLEPGDRMHWIFVFGFTSITWALVASEMLK